MPGRSFLDAEEVRGSNLRAPTGITAGEGQFRVLLNASRPQKVATSRESFCKWGHRSESGSLEQLHHGVLWPNGLWRSDTSPRQRPLYVTTLSFTWPCFQPACDLLSSWKIRASRGRPSEWPSLGGGRGVDEDRTLVEVAVEDGSTMQVVALAPSVLLTAVRPPRFRPRPARTSASPVRRAPRCGTGGGWRRSRAHPGHHRRCSSGGAVPDQGIAPAADDRRVLERGTRPAR
jgi:hypothetical protein